MQCLHRILQRTEHSFFKVLVRDLKIVEFRHIFAVVNPRANQVGRE